MSSDNESYFNIYLYPYVLQFSNNKHRLDQHNLFNKIPDVSTVLCRPTGELSMIAGDFIKVSSPV